MALQSTWEGKMYAWNGNGRIVCWREHQLEAITMKALSEQVGLYLVLKNGFIVAGSLLLHSWVDSTGGSRALTDSRSGGVAWERR